MQYKIKNIIFDLGGVIMNLNVPKTIENFESLGITNIISNTGHQYEDAIFYDFEMGKVSESQFLEKLVVLSNQNPPIVKIKRAWEAMILDIPKERIDFILQLKEKYNIFLLSNTNGIHQKKFLNDFRIHHNFSFNELFKKAYYSHEIGFRKPDNEVFEYVLLDSNLNPSETLFIDDNIQNINAAKNLGIQTLHIKKDIDFEIIFI